MTDDVELSRAADGPAGAGPAAAGPAAADRAVDPLAAGAADDIVTIPVVRDSATIGRRWVDAGGVRVSKSVTEREQLVELLLARDEVHVQRLAIERFLDEDAALPSIREEGDVLIVPILAEVLVKRTVLREEVRITRLRRESPATSPVVLREEHVSIRRLAEGDDELQAGPRAGNNPGRMPAGQPPEER